MFKSMLSLQNLQLIDHCQTFPIATYLKCRSLDNVEEFEKLSLNENFTPHKNNLR